MKKLLIYGKSFDSLVSMTAWSHKHSTFDNNISVASGELGEKLEHLCLTHIFKLWVVQYMHIRVDDFKTKDGSYVHKKKDFYIIFKLLHCSLSSLPWKMSSLLLSNNFLHQNTFHIRLIKECIVADYSNKSTRLYV